MQLVNCIVINVEQHLKHVNKLMLPSVYDAENQWYLCCLGDRCFYYRSVTQKLLLIDNWTVNHCWDNWVATCEPYVLFYLRFEDLSRLLEKTAYRTDITSKCRNANENDLQRDIQRVFGDCSRCRDLPLGSCTRRFSSGCYGVRRPSGCWRSRGGSRLAGGTGGRWSCSCPTKPS